ncbi:PREDICTED: BRISC and BRCA1-A complex member 1-like [Nicrophorus vespilloides]|uniref:BRISC and BRCA1-A complex member 1-like n=1 Tax=Nicrophorus vespilloides TaxID=110193 RepID=A0ABM1M6X8_NICVS|nr:PREDICTED: BRISC and BRCA1-A complex member 1-like [Nicrophorus vespilloides]
MSDSKEENKEKMKRANQSDEYKVESTTEEFDNKDDIEQIIVSDSDSPRQIDSTTKEEEPEDYVIPKKVLPCHNVPERIIIVYDRAEDEVSTKFELGAQSFTPADMIKRSLEFFLHNKSSIDNRHQFALVVLNENSVVWVKDFTHDVKSIITTLQDTPNCHTEDVLVLDKLFDLVNSKSELRKLDTGNLDVPPKYVVRILFVYGRSFTMPQIKNQDLRKGIVENPFFTFDVIMTHEKPNTDNNAERISKFLQNVDTKGFAYFFPVARNAKDLHIAMAKLLGHPLQRPCQKAANYFINT